MLPGFGVLSPALAGGVGGAPRTLCLGFHDGGLHGLGDRVVIGAGLKEQLEQDRSLELLEGIRDLVTGAARGVPLGDDAAGMRDPDAKVRAPYLAFPDDITLFHAAYVT